MTELAREYGEGLYELAVEEKLADVMLEQLTVLDASFREQPDFLRLLSNRALSRSERLGVIDSTLRGRVEPYLLNFLKLLCERDVMAEFSGCTAVFREHYNRDNNIAVATVTTAEPLRGEQRERLIEKLKAMTGRGVSLVEKTDASLMGGILLEMEGQRWDNTVKNRLDSIRRVLTEA